jgi:hypothetical protein
MCEESDKIIRDMMEALCNAMMPSGTLSITEYGTLCIELPAPDRNVFAMNVIVHSDSYECSFPGGINNGVRFEIDNPDTFIVHDEVDALVTIPEKLLEIFPRLSSDILESLKEGIHHHWREPGDVRDFVIETLHKKAEDNSWD